MTTNYQVLEQIEQRDDGKFVLQTLNEAVSFKMDMMGERVEYDSRNPEHKELADDPQLAAVASVVGMKVQLLIDSTGTVHDVVNMDEINAWVDGQQDPVAKMTLAGLAEKDTLISLNEMNYKLLPDAPVNVGDSWTREFATPFEFGDIIMRFELALQEVREADGEQIAEIRLGGSISIDPFEEGIVKINDSLILGKIEFNNTTGFYDFMDMTLDYEMVFQGDEENAVGMTLGVTWKPTEEE